MCMASTVEAQGEHPCFRGPRAEITSPCARTPENPRPRGGRWTRRPTSRTTAGRPSRSPVAPRNFLPADSTPSPHSSYRDQICMSQPWNRRAMASIIVALGLIAAARSSLPSAEPSVVVPNDNRHAAGTRIGDTVTIRLVVSRARWFPGADSGPSVVVEALAEEGKAPQIAAPLIRVPAGTHIVATVRNALPDSTVTVHGLQTRPAAAWDTVRLAPGETHTVRFLAGEPGTYSYFATIGHVVFPVAERETAGGAFVIDPVGARADDRVFVVNIWGNSPNPLTLTNALALNGKTWPYTERLSASLGDSVRYRIVNASMRAHPMHLHGFYFRVDGLGT